MAIIIYPINKLHWLSILLRLGGELFDHILAHRYLKERDACRLFAQLISGVNYLHQKHIVHRDLKLVSVSHSLLENHNDAIGFSLLNLC